MFSKETKVLMIENIRNASKRIKKTRKESDFIDIFELMAKIQIPNGDLVGDALRRQDIKTYDNILMKKGTYVISTLIYNITLRYVSDILRRLCMYGSSGTCSCPMSYNKSKECVGIHKCDDFIDHFAKEYSEISHD